MNNEETKQPSHGRGGQKAGFQDWPARRFPFPSAFVASFLGGSTDFSGRIASG
jgi:hypothetical protein